MTKFFTYLEQVLTHVNFFTTKSLLDEINDKTKTSNSKNKKFSNLKKEKIDNGDVYVYYLNNNPTFNFKIDDIMYELIFTVNYDQSLIKLGDKLTAMEADVDPKVGGRYGIAFYPRNLAGVKYDNVKLSSASSSKLFDYLRTCAEKIDNKKFYFDGAYTKRERMTIDKLVMFIQKMKSINDLKTKDDIYEHFLVSENHANLNLKNSTMLKVKKTIKDNNISFLKLLEKILFVIRDDLKLNFNVREKYFTNMLKKHGIKFEIGDKYTRTIFFSI